jgi:hypothetical protein
MKITLGRVVVATVAVKAIRATKWEKESLGKVMFRGMNEEDLIQSSLPAWGQSNSGLRAAYNIYPTGPPARPATAEYQWVQI